MFLGLARLAIIALLGVHIQFHVLKELTKFLQGKVHVLTVHLEDTVMKLE